MVEVVTETVHAEDKQSPRSIISLILKAVCIAMGVAVAVLSVLGEMNTDTAVTMLGIGVACAGISLLNKEQP